MSLLPPSVVALLDQEAAFWEEALDDAVENLRADIATQSEVEQMIAVRNTAQRIATRPPVVTASLLMAALLRLARQPAVTP